MIEEKYFLCLYLDLLFQLILDTPTLQIPHLPMAEQAFALFL